mmetsp:Transcript_380/g.646  ORF Transcript_380/g.646 Transcript_380/m.646 type:complete len:283 (+) Transcript_380:119-967(+)
MNSHHPQLSRYGNGEPVRTLFVRGLPNDVKPREIHNLFRPFPGFQSSSITYPGDRKTPVSFVVFKNQNSAVNAMDKLQGLRFDPETHVRLRIEFAKTNSKSKRPIPQTTPQPITPFQTQHAPFVPELPQTTQEPSTIGEIQDDNAVPDMSDENVRSIFKFFFTDSPESSPAVSHRNTESKRRTQDGTRKQNEPCSTIFLGNIHASHRTFVESALQSAEGFVKLKISQKDDSLLCWADFINIQYSTAVLNAIHPLTFPPAPGKQVRVEYAKNPMGEVMHRKTA